MEMLMSIEIPEIGLGTWELRGKKCIEVVKMALDLGYRHIDTAFAYENHKEIAKALKVYARDELFLTTKVDLGQLSADVYLSQANDQNIDESVESICDLALTELGVEYLDLLLIHWPDRNRPLEEILAALHKMVTKEKIRFVGVSNYTKHHLQDAYDANVAVAFNQVEFHPYLYQKQLLDFCKQHNTHLIAYRPLGKGKLLKEESLFSEIGKAHQKSAAQVVLRWIIQKRVPVIVKSVSSDHLKENLEIFDFTLSPEEEKKIDKLSCEKRFCGVTWNEFDY